MDPYVANLLHELGEDKARLLLDGLGQHAALREFNRNCAVRLAIELLQKGIATGVIRMRLRVRYDISERTAFRYFSDALASYCHDRRDSGSKRADDEGSPIGPKE